MSPCPIQFVFAKQELSACIKVPSSQLLHVCDIVNLNQFPKALTSEVIMDNSKLPEGYQIAFSSSCKDHVLRTGEEGRKCSNISIGDEVGFSQTALWPKYSHTTITRVCMLLNFARLVLRWASTWASRQRGVRVAVGSRACSSSPRDLVRWWRSCCSRCASATVPSTDSPSVPAVTVQGL